MFTTPVQIAIRQQKARDAENASRLGGLLHGLQLAPAFALPECTEARDIRAHALQHVLEGRGVLDVELALPESFEDLVVVGALLLLGARLPLRLGRLPGDIAIEGRRGSFYFPVVTCLLLSMAMTLIFWLVGFLRR